MDLLPPKPKYNPLRNESLSSLEEGASGSTPTEELPSPSASSLGPILPPLSGDDSPTTLCSFFPRMSNLKLANPAGGRLGLKGEPGKAAEDGDGNAGALRDSGLLPLLQDMNKLSGGGGRRTRVEGGQLGGEEWTRHGSFVNKPTRGWLHPNDKVMGPGVSYSVRYMGCVEVLQSMRALDFNTRTQVTREAISLVCEAVPGAKGATRRRKPCSHLSSILGRSNLKFAGMPITLTVSTSSLNLMAADCKQIIANHHMQSISFASGGDPDTAEYVAYVAKDPVNQRACHILECPKGLAQDVISTIGQAFELRFKQYLRNPPKLVTPHDRTAGWNVCFMSSNPDSDNSWVLAGSENLSVETLGPEPRMDPESEGASQTLSDPSKADGEELSGPLSGEGMLFQMEGSQNESGTLPEESVAKGALGHDGHEMELPADTLLQEDLQETPAVTSLGPDPQDLDKESPPQNLPSSSKAVWKERHCSSSDEDTDVDVEGLRRRRGRDASPPQPMVPVHVEDQAKGKAVGGELGISLNMCLLGTLVLLGLGILLFSGMMLEPETGPVEEAELQVFPDTGPETDLADTEGNRQDELEQMQAPAPPDSGPSLQSMGLLLDKLAKENQDIRLLQAQLQAHKEELRSLLQQPRGLEEENARLREALQQGKTSHQALESELQQLRARLQGLEADCVRGVDGVCLHWGGGPGDKATKEQGHKGQGPDPSLLEQHQRLEAEAQALREELTRQSQLLGSVRRDLLRGLRNAAQGAPARAGLAELGHMLAQTLQGLENWSHNTGVSANDSEAWYPRKPHLQNPREQSKKKWHGGPRDQKAEHWKHRKGESGPERRESWEGEDREASGGWKENKPRLEELGNRKDGKHQDAKAHPRKSGDTHSGERQKHSWGKNSKPDPLSWDELLRRKYRPPQGCSGVGDCARQEGLALFGTELAPVQQQELASVLRAYLARLPWAGPLTKELPLSPAYFGEDGIFRHDRLRFRDFVDALEDSLEAVALKQMGDDDEVDDFEDFIFSHFFGDKALKKRSRKKEKHSWNPRVVGPREEDSRHPHHYHHG
ncbi:pre-B-cell leukemia transcription factor-interacting protein 1 isoform X1 [Sigmodon hispidus]